jgi:SWI/SNF chromatin-remodeling complex subunit SWI1
MEAILMGIRSRLPRELGYALTVLSMLSMPHPEENIGGLPLFHAQEIYLELLELISEAAFGEEGYDAWAKGEAQLNPSTTGAAVGAGVDAAGDLNRMSWIELEQLGRDFDFSFDLDGMGLDVQIPTKKERDHTGGSTDIILTGLNLLRNFSMMPENHATMAQVPDLFHLLGRISDARLARLPGQSGSTGSAGLGDKPFSILELARVRRDCVTILTNLGGILDLRKVSSDSVVAVFRLLSTFLTSGWESLHHRESPFGPTPSIRDAPPPVILSINRAVEAWCKLAQSDSNREVLSRVPAEELVALFEGLVRLFPVDRRGFEAMHTVEDFLGFTECLALSCYSLAFLSPLSVRASMRSIPGITNVLMRIIFQTAPAGQRGDFKNNPFNVLCRRVCETLGVLNGTVSASGDVETMGFSAGSGGEGNGTGWTFRSRPVEKAWLAGYGENLVSAMMIKGMDLPTFEELDGLWWAGNEEI